MTLLTTEFEEVRPGSIYRLVGTGISCLNGIPQSVRPESGGSYTEFFMFVSHQFPKANFSPIIVDLRLKSIHFDFATLMRFRPSNILVEEAGDKWNEIIEVADISTVIQFATAHKKWMERYEERQRKKQRRLERNGI